MTSILGTESIQHPNGTASATILADGTLSSAGHIIQVVQATTSTEVATTSTSFVSTGFFATITPKFSSSKILVSYNSAIHNNTGNYLTITDVYRDPSSSTGEDTAISGGTSLSGGNTYGLTQTYSQTAAIVETVHTQILDSPSTTSEVKYVIAYKSISGGTSYFATNGTLSTLTLMEIAQ